MVRYDSNDEARDQWEALEDEGPLERDLRADDPDEDLTACPSCGRQVYADTQRCPHCGDWIVPDAVGLRQRPLTLVVVALLLILLMLLFVVFRR
jgi:uncharacterized paraquat-inducible protein A